MNHSSEQKVSNRTGKRKARWFTKLSLGIATLLLVALPSMAQTVIPKITIGIDQASGPQDLTVAVQILLMLTVLALAPSIMVMMTCFTRIVIVLHFLRQAMATQQVPPNQVVVALALFLTFFIMSPTIDYIYQEAWIPLQNEEISAIESLQVAGDALKQFMLAQTREKDLALFVKYADIQKPQTSAELPLKVVIPGFILSELRIGFQIGFLLYLPFLIIDMVIASVLMSMGMMMLPPVMVSMPFKLLLFVLADGWYLMIQSVVESFVGIP
ncbi:flagellar type III secretion system pore protein FliP [bacterium]|nr:flagellar type III secretion system pore protein FliP [bacterium]MBU1652159.1 flagellar type III secretion system pore protein FliP [bacterium]MBU1881459.1 flagellar type III secretion system pore protein FliP [bacterium]